MIREIHNMKNVAVSYEKDGKLIVGVVKKVPLFYLEPKDRIPKILENGMETDVIVVPRIRSSMYCNQTGDGCGIHAIRHRPLLGGISFCPEDSGAGTLGVFVKDNFDNTIVALTCNHVLGPTLGEESLLPDVYVSDLKDVEILQPSPLDGGSSPNDLVAKGKNTVGIVFGPDGINTIDAATATITNINLSTPGVESLVRGGLFPFAEKYEYSTGNTVCKVGRTTGHSTGEILLTTVNINVLFGPNTPNNTAYFENVIMITSTERFSAPGDSGSAVFCKIGGQWKIIGILFAGDDLGLNTFVCHISDIATLLDLSAWEGEIGISASSNNVIIVNGLCYYDFEEEIAGDISHTPEQSFTDCAECLPNESKKTLFGNIL